MDATRPRVLVVDDLPDSADSAADLLTLWGYDARPHYDGVSALESVRIRKPLAVLLDLDMAPMDGFEFAARLRRVPGCSRTAIIAQTRFATEEHRVRSREMRIEHCLVKPVRLGCLRTILDALAAMEEPWSFIAGAADGTFAPPIHPRMASRGSRQIPAGGPRFDASPAPEANLESAGEIRFDSGM